MCSIYIEYVPESSIRQEAEAFLAAALVLNRDYPHSGHVTHSVVRFALINEEKTAVVDEELRNRKNIQAEASFISAERQARGDAVKRM